MSGYLADIRQRWADGTSALDSVQLQADAQWLLRYATVLEEIAAFADHVPDAGMCDWSAGECACGLAELLQERERLIGGGATA